MPFCSKVAFSRVILGVSAGVYTVIAFNTAAKLVQPDQIGRAAGMITIGINSAMVLGVPLGVYIAKWLSWQANFAVLALLAFFAWFGIAKLLPPMPGDVPVPFRKQFTVLKDPVIVSGLGFSFLLTISVSILNTYMTPYLQTVLQQGTPAIAVMLLLFGVVSIVGARLGGIYSDKWGTARLMIFGLIAVVFSLALLPLLAAWPLLAAGLLLIWVLAFSMVVPAVQAYFIQYAQDFSNFVLGLNMSILHFGVAAGAGAGGIVLSSWQTPATILGLQA